MSNMFDVATRGSGVITNTLIDILLMIDSIIYWLISVIYQVFMLVAETNLFDTTAAIGQLTERIYVVFGVAMLFVFAYNIILLIANPDKLSDKSDNSLKGIAKNAFISILAIALLPTIFNYMKVVQNEVLRSNVIGNVILGGISSNDNNLQNAGARVSVNVFSTFFHPLKQDENGEYSIDVTIDECHNNPAITPICEIYYQAYYDAQTTGNINDFILNDELSEAMSWEFLGVGAGDYEGQMKYIFIVSTAVGIFVGYLFISFTFDIAIRTVKLAVLQVIAPLPIMARIMKPTGGFFSKWLKEVKDTYLLLFLRLAIIYFVVFMISFVIQNFTFLNSDSTPGSGILWFVARLFIIVGLLVFAKQAPKLIENLVGSLAGGSWSLKKKLSGEDYEFARRAAGVGGTLLRGLGRSAVDTFGYRDNEGHLRRLRLTKVGEDGRRHFDKENLREIGKNAYTNALNTPGNIIHGARYGWQNGNVDLSQGFRQGLSNYANAINQSTEQLFEHNQRAEQNRQDGVKLFGHRIPGFSRLTGYARNNVLTGTGPNVMERVYGDYDLFSTSTATKSMQDISGGVKSIAKDSNLCNGVDDKKSEYNKQIDQLKADKNKQITGIAANFENIGKERIENKYDNDIANITSELKASRDSERAVKTSSITEKFERTKADILSNIDQKKSNEYNKRIESLKFEKEVNGLTDAQFNDRVAALENELNVKYTQERETTIANATQVYETEIATQNAKIDSEYEANLQSKIAEINVKRASEISEFEANLDANRKAEIERVTKEIDAQIKKLTADRDNAVAKKKIENVKSAGDKDYLSKEFKITSPSILENFSHLSLKDMKYYFAENGLDLGEVNSISEGIEKMKSFCAKMEHDLKGDNIDKQALDELDKFNKISEKIANKSAVLERHRANSKKKEDK